MFLLENYEAQGQPVFVLEQFMVPLSLCCMGVLKCETTGQTNKGTLQPDTTISTLSVNLLQNTTDVALKNKLLLVKINRFSLYRCTKYRM